MRRRFVAHVGERRHEVTVEEIEVPRGEARLPCYRVTIDGRERVVDARDLGQRVWSVIDEQGRAHLADLDGAPGDGLVTVGGHSFPYQLVDARRAVAAGLGGRRESSGPQAVKAPMPGRVVKLLVKPGDEVTAGQGVLIVEAMKMENELKAPRAGKVAEVKVKEGQAVESGESLVTIG